MSNFFFFEIIYALEFLEFICFYANVVDFDGKVSNVFVDAVDFDFLCFFDEFGESREGAFDGFDSHVVVHLLPHEGGLSIRLGLLADGEGVQL